MRRMTVALAGMALLVSSSAWALDSGCDVLHVLGFPGSCEWACHFGWNSAFSNQMCIFDILINFT